MRRIAPTGPVTLGTITLSAFTLGALAPPAIAGDGGLTQLVSRAPGGGPGNAASGTGPIHATAVTSDARYTAFMSQAPNLVLGDTNALIDVFRLDLDTGAIVRCNLGPAGVQANDWCFLPDISADGNFVAWSGHADNLVVGDSNVQEDVFVRDVASGVTERVSVSNTGTQGNSASSGPSISGDGRYVVFWSLANNLVSFDGNGNGDIFLRDRLLNRTLALTILPTGLQANANSSTPRINELGTHVVFVSFATNLVSGDTNGIGDLFLYDLQMNSVARIGQPTGPAQSNGDAAWPSLSADAGLVAFEGEATNLVPGDTNGLTDIFVQDISTGVIRRVSVDSNGVQANGASEDPHLSADGQHIVFTSLATNLVPNDNNGHQDVFIHHLATGVTELVSRSTAPLGNANEISFYPVVSGDGLTVVFASAADNLVVGDPNGFSDVFTRRWPAPPQIVCIGNMPGSLCPCGNTSGGLNGGCRNSTAVGAVPSWFGSTSIATDDASVFCAGLPPGVPSLLFSGPQLLNGGAGVAFGDGLRCAGGPIQRLGVRLASAGGSASWGPGLAALGGWGVGETQILQVWYRDVSGPCGTGFNTSSAIEAELFP